MHRLKPGSFLCDDCSFNFLLTGLLGLAEDRRLIAGLGLPCGGPDLRSSTPNVNLGLGCKLSSRSCCSDSEIITKVATTTTHTWSLHRKLNQTALLFRSRFAPSSDCTWTSTCSGHNMLLTTDKTGWNQSFMIVAVLHQLLLPSTSNLTEKLNPDHHETPTLRIVMQRTWWSSG